MNRPIDPQEGDSVRPAADPTSEGVTPERALALLRKANVNLQDFVSNPRVFDAACKTVYRMLPPPARWALREKGVRRILEKARDLYIATSGPTYSNALVEQPD